MNMAKLEGEGFKHLTPASEALKRILKEVKPLEVEEIEVIHSVGRVSSQKIVSQINKPNTNKAMMDGYGVSFEDIKNASIQSPIKLRVKGLIHAEEIFRGKIKRGEAVQVMTGATLPENIDTVLKYEEVEKEGCFIKVFQPVSKWGNVSRVGEDIKKGDVVLEKGERVTIATASLLSSLGIGKIKVSKKPKVAVLVTGSELVSPDRGLKPGKIFESNTTLLSNLAKFYGCIVEKAEVVPDDLNEIKRKIRSNLKCDLIITSGGMSAGRRDHTHKAIEELGRILFHGVTIRPGTPSLGAVINKKVVLGLPGSPAACLIAFIYFAIPIISKMTCNKAKEEALEAEMISNYPSRLGRMDALRVKLKNVKGKIYAEPIRIKGASLLSSIKKADGIVFIPEKKEGLEKGEIVKVHPIPKY